MRSQIRNIVIECPDPEALSAFYAELLDMYTLRKPPDWTVIGRDGELPRLAFDRADDYRPPRWLDPDHPRQLHLDVTVPDRAAAERWLSGSGATRLPEDIGAGRHVWADPAGHPFGLREDPSHPPRIESVVLDSADHVALASFYARLLDLPKVGQESDDWTTIGTSEGPRLRFARVAVHRQPRWPDPAYPQQMHLDLQFDAQDAATERAERLGASRLPAMGGDAPVYADPAGHPFCVCPMYTPIIQQMFLDAWTPWLATLDSIDPAATRSPGVCGDWTIHDVVGHVQANARFRLAHLRGAFTGRAPTQEEVDGERAPWPDGVGYTADARNAAIRDAGVGLSWQQLLDEAAWIRDQTVEWLEQLDERLLDVNVGWVEFWEPPFRDDPNTIEDLMVRRTRELPSAKDPLPVWRFVQPDEPDNHLTEHLDQIHAWLVTSGDTA
ncbi:VOC family protein [Actinopolymorpha alba]|uniref:VOC family protein n=1 Tax=Actinopolymorpha alba TaxID=533267 RepID=UPI0003A0E32D|nr:VOC family protein [Actinopolymorpha alba]